MITNPLSDLTVGVFVVAVLAAAAALVWLLKRMREQRPSSKHDVAVAPSTHPELVAQEAASPAQPTELQISPPPLQVQAERPALSASTDSQLGSSNPESTKRRGKKKRHSKGRSLKSADSMMPSSSSSGTILNHLATEVTTPSCPRREPASDASGGKSATWLQRQPSNKSLGSTHFPRSTRLVGDVPRVPPELDIFSREHTSMTASPQPLSPGIDFPTTPSATGPANGKSSHRIKRGRGSDSRKVASEQKNPEASEPNNDVRRAPESKTSLGPSPP